MMHFTSEAPRTGLLIESSSNGDLAIVVSGSHTTNKHVLTRAAAYELLGLMARAFPDRRRGERRVP